MRTSPYKPEQTLRVGPPGSIDCDVTGLTGRAIQTAIDALALQGGGTVEVAPGTYILHDAVRLRSNIRLIGDRKGTILKRGPLVISALKLDADVGQDEISPLDPAAFKTGMGVALFSPQTGWVYTSLPYTITRIDNGVLYLHHYLTQDVRQECDGVVVNYFPLILAENADHCVIDGFTLDGTVPPPARPVPEGPAAAVARGLLDPASWAMQEPETKGIAGPRTALVYFFRSRHGVMRRLLAKNSLGDGLCFGKTSLGMTVEDCETVDNHFYGIHPGSHSAYCAVRRCHIHRNGCDGLYICWGIHHSTFEDNDIHHNGWRLLRSGLCIGHKDTDNLILRNRIYENKKFGICFRTKTEGNGAHRNVVRENLIENNGSRPDELADLKKRLQPWEGIGCGIHVGGVTKDLVFENNIIRETRTGDARTQRHALYLAKDVSNVKALGNTVEGHLDEPFVDVSGRPQQEIDLCAAERTQ